MALFSGVGVWIDIYGCCLFSVSPIPVHFHYALCIMNYALRSLSGGYSGGVPPLPIPNREVKPVIADGTAMQCGRVGSRLLSDGEVSQQGSLSFFLSFPKQNLSSLMFNL